MRCDDTVDSVRCGHEWVTESAYDSVADHLFRAQTKTRLDRGQQEQKRAPTQGSIKPMREPSCDNLAELRRAKS